MCQLSNVTRPDPQQIRKGNYVQRPYSFIKATVCNVKDPT